MNTDALKGWGLMVKPARSGNQSRTRYFTLDTGEKVFASGLVDDVRNVNRLQRGVFQKRLADEGITDPGELFRLRAPRRGRAAQ
jgi:hypothetical protein